MESYRLSSKLRQKDREYLIQTCNDANLGSILTTVYVDGVPAETVTNPHPEEINPEEVLSFVKVTHGEKKKEVESLLSIYQRVAESTDPQTMYHLGTAFFYKGFYEEAKELFQAVTGMMPDNHQAQNLLGMTELAIGNFDAAVTAAKAAVETRPGYADYRNNYAEALLASGQTGQAIKELERAIKVNLYYSDAYFNLGLAHILQEVNAKDARRLPQAIEITCDYFHRASLIYANFKGLAFEEGLAALKKHDLVQALGILKRIREEKKEMHRREFASFYMKFVLHPDCISRDAIVERISFLEAELKKNPTYVDLHAELAQCHLEQARLAWKDGMEQLRVTAEINPSLSKIAAALEKADAVYEQIDRVLEPFSEGGCRHP